MSSRNDTIINETGTLTRDDLIDIYEKLAQSYRELKRNHETLNQKLYQEISHKKALENSLQDIQSELDSINEIHEKSLSQVHKKNEELKDKNYQLIMEKTILENKIDELDYLIAELQNECTELKALVVEKSIKPRYSDTYSRSLELENENLRTSVNEIMEKFKNLEELHQNSCLCVEELNERLVCMQDNLESKKSELDDKNETVEQLQEKMHELSSELALLKSSDQDENNRKGNSLFAEVDDQRQKIKKILQCERTHYTEMKKAYNAKEMEIRRLKRENLNIKSEIQACNKLLERGEQLASNHTNIYVSQLESDKKNLEIQLKDMEQKLIDISKQQKMHWVESILTSTSTESRDLKDKNYMLLREKTSLADSHRKALNDLAKSRLDSIKLRVLLGRIVVDNKLMINAKSYCDIGVDEEIFENLKLEEFEKIDSGYLTSEIIKREDESFSGMLNESTIFLLGGRERLGNAIPSHSNTAVDEKENLFIQEQNKTSTPVKSTSMEQPLKEKIVQFSAKVESKFIDSTKEQYEASQEARKKRPAFTVKRIIIPSKKTT